MDAIQQTARLDRRTRSHHDRRGKPLPLAILLGSCWIINSLGTAAQEPGPQPEPILARERVEELFEVVRRFEAPSQYDLRISTAWIVPVPDSEPDPLASAVQEELDRLSSGGAPDHSGLRLLLATARERAGSGDHRATWRAVESELTVTWTPETTLQVQRFGDSRWGIYLGTGLLLTYNEPLCQLTVSLPPSKTVVYDLPTLFAPLAVTDQGHDWLLNAPWSRRVATEGAGAQSLPPNWIRTIGKTAPGKSRNEWFSCSYTWDPESRLPVGMLMRYGEHHWSYSGYEFAEPAGPDGSEGVGWLDSVLRMSSNKGTVFLDEWKLLHVKLEVPEEATLLPVGCLRQVVDDRPGSRRRSFGKDSSDWPVEVLRAVILEKVGSGG